MIAYAAHSPGRCIGDASAPAGQAFATRAARSLTACQSSGNTTNSPMVAAKAGTGASVVAGAYGSVR